MVLEIRLNIVWLLFLLLLSSGCNATNDGITDKAEIMNYKLTLKNINDKCLLESNNNKKIKYLLKMKPPCYFLRKQDKSIQTFEYNDVYIKATVLIIGDLISNEKRKKWNLDKKNICGESRQAILIKQAGLNISEKILKGGLICKDLGADEKDFWYFAH